MRIQLKQPEIEKAIIRYLSEQGIVTDNKAITLSFTSGRKGNGLSAEVKIDDIEHMPAADDQASEAEVVVEPLVIIPDAEPDGEPAEAIPPVESVAEATPVKVGSLFSNE